MCKDINSSLRTNVRSHALHRNSLNPFKGRRRAIFEVRGMFPIQCVEHNSRNNPFVPYHNTNASHFDLNSQGNGVDLQYATSNSHYDEDNFWCVNMSHAQKVMTLNLFKITHDVVTLISGVQAYNMTKSICNTRTLVHTLMTLPESEKISLTMCTKTIDVLKETHSRDHLNQLHHEMSRKTSLTG